MKRNVATEILRATSLANSISPVNAMQKTMSNITRGKYFRRSNIIILLEPRMHSVIHRYTILLYQLIGSQKRRVRNKIKFLARRSFRESNELRRSERIQ